jgi:uncharacterized protein with FMN-binding domain
LKKLLSIGTVLAVSLSLSACARNNTAYDNNNPNPNTNTNIGQNRNTVRRLSQRNITNSHISTSTNLADGVYTGEGNRHANGNETAIVTVKNGRIAFITLRSLDNTGRNRLQGVNNTNIINNNVGQNVPNNTGMPNGALRNTGGVNNTNTAGNITNMRNPNNTGIVNGTGTTDNTADFFNNNGIANNNIVTDNNGITNNYGITNNTGAIKNNDNNRVTGNVGLLNNDDVANNYTIRNQVTTSLDTMRSKLVRAMMRNQTYDVATPTADRTLLNTATNWKLAVQRALQRASR